MDVVRPSLLLLLLLSTLLCLNVYVSDASSDDDMATCIRRQRDNTASAADWRRRLNDRDSGKGVHQYGVL